MIAPALVMALEEYPPPGPWSRYGACRTQPKTLFFPTDVGGVALARRVCAACTVLEQCREYALAAPDSLCGVWGGLSQEARRRLRRERGMAS